MVVRVAPVLCLVHDIQGSQQQSRGRTGVTTVQREATKRERRRQWVRIIGSSFALCITLQSTKVGLYRRSLSDASDLSQTSAEICSVRDNTHAATLVKVDAQSKGYLTSRPTAVAGVHGCNHRIERRNTKREVAPVGTDRRISLCLAYNSSTIQRCVLSQLL